MLGRSSMDFPGDREKKGEVGKHPGLNTRGGVMCLSIDIASLRDYVGESSAFFLETLRRYAQCH